MSIEISTVPDTKPSHEVLPPPAVNSASVEPVLNFPKFRDLKAIGFWFLCIRDALSRWRNSRSWYKFWLSLPALITAVSIIGASTWLFGKIDDTIIQYQARLVTAIDAQDINTQQVLLNSLLQWKPNELHYRYHLALVRAKQGNPQAAFAIMGSLAPTEKPGYGRAHFWIAEQLLYAQKPISSERMKAAVAHLRHGLTSLPENVSARIALGHALKSLSEWTEAEKQFAEITRTHPAAWLEIARIRVKQERGKEARIAAASAEQHFRLAVESRDFNMPAHLSLAEAMFIERKFDDAERILLKVSKTLTAAESERLLVPFYLTTSLELPALTIDDFQLQLSILEKALKIAPQNNDLILRLATIVASCEQKPELPEQLESILATGSSPALIHLVLGTGAFQRGDSQLAMMHFRQSHKLAPQMPVVANNLAWALLNQPGDEQLDEAMQIINSALELIPDNPAFLDTRGQILARQGMWSEALADLEKALQEMPQNSRTHQALAATYTGLGQPSLANKHRKLAEHFTVPTQTNVPPVESP